MGSLFNNRSTGLPKEHHMAGRRAMRGHALVTELSAAATELNLSKKNHSGGRCPRGKCTGRKGERVTDACMSKPADVVGWLCPPLPFFLFLDRDGSWDGTGATRT